MHLRGVQRGAPWPVQRMALHVRVAPLLHMVHEPTAQCHGRRLHRSYTFCRMGEDWTNRWNTSFEVKAILYHAYRNARQVNCAFVRLSASWLTWLAVNAQCPNTILCEAFFPCNMASLRGALAELEAAAAWIEDFGVLEPPDVCPKLHLAP